ncbi:MAG: haloalkane dehalogenase [Deltaproteobacteria bacterium]|nr:haloalkane dehalogenase [Deltaproteobacteria bacterium]
MISAEERYAKRSISVKGLAMACVDEGAGAPIVFLHGNPTSSYLWRNIIPHLAGQGRCIAPDLLGMGDSQKLPQSGPESYTFAQHREYLDLLLDELQLGSEVTLVVHDWGSALGFDWANRHRERVKGIAYMEALVAPVTWAQWPKPMRQLFQAFRSPAGEKLVLEQNIFVEQVLPQSVLRGLSEAEMAVYRRPFAEAGESRRPTLTWPRQIPIEGEPAEVVRIVSDYSAWLSQSPLPKLFVNAKPGAILRGELRELCRSWPNTTEVTVPGTHFIQEDSPGEIGRAISEWLREIG